MRRAWPVLPISSMKCEADAFSCFPSPPADASTPPPAMTRSRPTFRSAIRLVASRARALVGVQRLGMTAQLGERLAQPVEGIGIAAQLEDLLVAGDRRLPFPARRLPDGDVAQLASLAGRGVRLPKRIVALDRERRRPGLPAEGAL